MEERFNAPRGRLLTAVLWTAVALVWAVLLFVCIALRQFAGAGMLALSAAAFAVCAAACAVAWRNYARARKNAKP